MTGSGVVELGPDIPGMTKPEVRELLGFLERVNTEEPSREDLRKLRSMLKESPGLWRLLADLTEITTQKLIDKISGTALIAESLKHARMEMQNELGHATASALEKLLIETVFITWLRYTDTERRYTAVVMADKGLTLRQANWWEKRLSAAQGRYLRACTTLARIRKMRLPAMQVNIATEGGQQVNIVE